MFVCFWDSLLQQFFNLSLDVLQFLSCFEASHDLSLLVDEELGEVPLDVGLLLVVGVRLGKHILEQGSNGVVHIPSCETLLLLEELEKGIGIVAIDLDLLEAGELCAEVQFTELVDAFVCTRSLLSELVAGEVENLETLSVILLIEFLQFVILRSESTLGCCIDYQQHLIGVLFQRDVLTFSVLDSEIVNGFHFLF